jgi:hypothetical protein
VNRLLTRLALTTMLAVLAIAGMPARQSVAQSMDLQPGIVISVASLDTQFSDVENLVEASGFGQMKGLVRMGASEYVKGLDATRPWGAMLFFEGASPEPEVLAFVPVKDIEDVLDTLAQFADIDGEDGEYVITPDGGVEMHVQVVEGTAFISPNKERLADLPLNPVELLDNLHSEYNVAARIYGQRIPAELRQQMIDLIREGAMQEFENDDSPGAAIQKANFEYSMRSIESFINETDEIVVGMCVDEAGKRLFADVKLVGLPESSFAKQAATFAEAGDSRFSGFVHDSTSANANFAGKFTKEDAEQAIEALDNIFDEARKSLDEEQGGDLTADDVENLQKAIDAIRECSVDTMNGGIVDMGMALSLDKNELRFAAASSVSNSAKLEEALKNIAKTLDGKGIPVKFDFDMSNEDGVRWHQVEVEIPEGEEEARGVFGNSIKIQIGVADDAVYLAVGNSAREFLKECLDRAADGSEKAAMQMNFRLLPILKFISKVQDSSEMNMLVESLPEEGDDRIRMTAQMIENGQLLRMEMQNGILEIFGKVGMAMGGGFQPPEDF